MPTFIPRQRIHLAHKVRYEDVYMQSEDQPDWFADALAAGELVPVPESKGLRVCNLSGPEMFAALGDWVLQRPDQSLLCVSDETLAEHYQLVS